jgi:hypothetical protein
LFRALLDQLDQLDGKVRRVKSVNVNSKTLKDDAIALATEYFEEHRARATMLFQDEALITAFDGDWQHLVRLAQGNNARRSYQTLLRRLRKTIAELNVSGIATPSSSSGETTTAIDFSRAETQLLQTLEGYVPSAAASYKQGILDLDPKQERVSYRGTASEFREALRETMDHLAPDADVMAEPNFKAEENQKKPTMKQKVAFILGSRSRSKTQRKSTEKATEVVDALCGEVARAVYDRASLSTHVETTRSEVIKIKRYVDTVLFDLLEIADR